jgi:mono/diheme cytochrome c family protein
MKMKAWKGFLLALLLVAAIGAIFGVVFVRRGFRASNQPSRIETVVARAARNLSIPREARGEKNPEEATPENLQNARDDFAGRCQTCHGRDGSGLTPVGQSLYPRVPDLR